MLYSLPHFRERLLAALADYSLNRNELHNLSEVALAANLEWMPGWLHHSVVRLESWKFIETGGQKSIDDERFLTGRITTLGLEHLNSEDSKQALSNSTGETGIEFPETPADWVILSRLLLSNNSANRARLCSFEEIKDSVNRNNDDEFVRQRLDFLIRSGYVRKVHMIPNGEAFELAPQGVWFIIQHAPTIFDFAQWPHADQPPEEVYDLLEAVREWDRAVHTASEYSEYSNHSIPASDRIVALNHNSGTYKEACEKLEEVTANIRGLNADVNFDKEQVVGELDAARTLLKSAKVRVGALIAMALSPLYTVYHDVAAESIRPLVAAAIEALKKLIGLY